MEEEDPVVQEVSVIKRSMFSNLHCEVMFMSEIWTNSMLKLVFFCPDAGILISGASAKPVHIPIPSETGQSRLEGCQSDQCIYKAKKPACSNGDRFGYVQR